MQLNWAPRPGSHASRGTIDQVGRTITLFMWGFQDIFRRSLEFDVKNSLEAIGAPSVEPTVFLIGLLKEGGEGHPICIEPENGPVVPEDFAGLDEHADELDKQNPDRKIRYSNAPAWIVERKEDDFRGVAYGTAISEVLERKLGLRFFASLPAPVNGYDVYTLIGLPDWVLDSTPQLKSEFISGRYRVTRSLVQGVVDELLRLSRREMRQPYAGADLALDIKAADVAKAAVESMMASVSMLAGDIPSLLFEAMNSLVTTRYEGRVGTGSLLLAPSDSESIERSVTFRDPVRVHPDTRRVLRKLLETSGRTEDDGESLLTDGHYVYGLAHLRSDHPDESESVFKLAVTGDGTWELAQAGVTLAMVEFGAPKIPKRPLQRRRFDDMCSRMFGECDRDALWALADAAKGAEHGTMLVISERAEDEAKRLASQAIPTEVGRLGDDLVPSIASIDGAILVDPSAYCHAIGVILDGTATTEGDRSRGARFNSAVKYIASQKGSPTMVLIVSEDGMINLLPNVPPRIPRSKRDAMLADLRKAAEADPVNGEAFYNAYRPIQENEFYFSPEQIDEINHLMEDHWRRRIAEGGPQAIRVIEPKLVHNEKMSDDYLMDD
jgi:hypothetical protein